MTPVRYDSIRRSIRRRRLLAVVAVAAVLVGGATGFRAFATGGWWRAPAPVEDVRDEPRGVRPPSPVDRPDPTPRPAWAVRTLRPGDSGPAVRALQERLDALGYRVLGTLDGVFGPVTEHALIAFQKVHGLRADGVAGPATRRALADPVPPEAREGGPGLHVEVDLARQVLFVVEDGTVTEVYDVSTGSGEVYWQDGTEQVAVTPPGRFAITWRYDGWRHAELGTLYRPAYFNGGIAIHGSPSVPVWPASHGCVRVTNWVMDHLFPQLVEGTVVLVH